jgi:hypothetical protein
MGMDKDESSQQRDPAGASTGWPPGSIGDLSARVGYDVRDLIMAGYGWDEIHEVAYGRITLDELLKRGPRRKDTTA